MLEAPLDHRFLVIVLWLVAVGVGLDSLRKLPIDAVPDVTNVQVQILSNSPGLGPEEMEQFILDHHEYGQDFQQYQAVKAVAEREVRRREADENRRQRELEKAQRQARQAAEGSSGWRRRRHR